MHYVINNGQIHAAPYMNAGRGAETSLRRTGALAIEQPRDVHVVYKRFAFVCFVFMELLLYSTLCTGGHFEPPPSTTALLDVTLLVTANNQLTMNPKDGKMPSLGS